MGKKIKINDWKQTIHDINKNYPNIRLITSIITGFPGETEEDFNKTLKLLQDLLFDRIDVYSYTERPNLPSLKLTNQVPTTTKLTRLKKAQNLARINTLRKKNKTKKNPILNK